MFKYCTLAVDLSLNIVVSLIDLLADTMFNTDNIEV